MSQNNNQNQDSLGGIGCFFAVIGAIFMATLIPEMLVSFFEIFIFILNLVFFPL